MKTSHPEGSFDLKAYLLENRARVNAALDEILGQNSISTKIIDIIRYCLISGGKRIRPVLCIAAAESVGSQAGDVMDAACALEMIHTYSLIHDDLPAMDDDDLRRGQPSCHIAFGESEAILAGDALLTLAFQVLSAPALSRDENAAGWLKVIHAVATSSGYQGMVEGQLRDIASEGMPLRLPELETIYRLKTGALIEASVYSGALLGGADPMQLAALVRYAKKIGLVFQIIDDILDVEGNPEITGKAVGSDKSRGKSTYPSILGLESSKAVAMKLANDALQSIESFDSKSDPLRAIARYMVHRKQ
ncbi:MAG: polyprenyl synthetase family protein [Desulfobacterales bacterium]|nr:polyprenyl synthetase family protein [Desulfobacterales bacterium]